MKEILKLTIPQFMKEFSKLTEEQIVELILNREFLNSDNSIVLYTFTNCSEKNKDLFINNNDLLTRILKIISKQKLKFWMMNRKKKL